MAINVVLQRLTHTDISIEKCKQMKLQLLYYLPECTREFTFESENIW